MALDSKYALTPLCIKHEISFSVHGLGRFGADFFSRCAARSMWLALCKERENKSLGVNA
jgi:hypothetical protein